MANGAGHEGHAWRKSRAIVLSPRPLICVLCRTPIDHRVKYPDPWAPEVHCVIPVSRGGTTDPMNCVPTHRKCNLAQGSHMPWEGPFAQPQWVEGLDP